MSDGEKPFEEFLLSLSLEQRKVFLEKLHNPNVYNIMKELLPPNQYEKLLKAKKEIDRMQKIGWGGSLSGISRTGTSRSGTSQSDTSKPTFSFEYGNMDKNMLEAKQEMVVSRLSDNLKILLLGQPGLGKSTMINSFANYLKYPTYEGAEKGKRHIYVKGHFMFVHNKEKSPEIIFTPSSDSAKLQQTDTNKTVSMYKVSISEGSSEKSITFFDTAGFFADTTSETSNDNTLDFAENGDYDAALLLIPSDLDQMTDFIEIFLSKAIDSCPVNKIFFCFTKSWPTEYQTYVTFCALKEFLQKKKPELLESLSRRCFCFENNSFLYLCAPKMDDIESPNMFHDLETSWDLSVRNMYSLFTHIILNKECGSQQTRSSDLQIQIIDGFKLPLCSLPFTSVVAKIEKIEKPNLPKNAFELYSFYNDCGLIDGSNSDKKFDETISKIKSTGGLEQVTSAVSSSKYDKFEDEEFFTELDTFRSLPFPNVSSDTGSLAYASRKDADVELHSAFERAENDNLPWPPVADSSGMSEASKLLDTPKLSSETTEKEKIKKTEELEQSKRKRKEEIRQLRQQNRDEIADQSAVKYLLSVGKNHTAVVLIISLVISVTLVTTIIYFFEALLLLINSISSFERDRFLNFAFSSTTFAVSMFLIKSQGIDRYIQNRITDTLFVMRSDAILSGEIEETFKPWNEDHSVEETITV